MREKSKYPMMLTFIRQLTFKCKHPIALYLCECGNHKEMDMYSVKNGYLVSCGCYANIKRTQSKIKYTHTIPKLHNQWTSMKSRCYNMNNSEYFRYGGSGFTVCDEWLDYQNFLDWSLANGWKPGLQLDKDKRANGSNQYSPDTCSWLTPRENTNNRKNTIFVRIDGIKQPLKPLCEKEDLNYYSIQKRIRKGVDFQIAKFLYLNKQQYHAA